VSLWQAVASLFLPPHRRIVVRSPYEGDVDQARRERPLPTTTQTRWYQDDVENAIRAADQGDMGQAARLSRSLRRDGVLGGVLSTRTGGLTRLPKSFRGTESVVAELTSFEELGIGLFDRIFSARELALLDGDGILLGVGVGEMLPVPGRREPVFVRLDPEFLRYQWSEDRWFYQSTAGMLPITPGDGRWILHTPGGYLQPWQSGLWGSLARAYVSKDHAFNYRENYNGKLANPARVATAPQGATEAQKQSFFQRVMAWGVNTVFGLVPGWDVKLLESNGRGFEVFEQTIATANEEIIIGLAGQLVTTTGGTGFANAGVHATIRADLIQDDGDSLATTINTQGLRPLIDRWFGSAARAAVAWDTRPPADLKAEADTITAAAKAIEESNRVLAPYGMRVDAREIVTRFRVPVTLIGEAAGSQVSSVTAPADEGAETSELEEAVAEEVAANDDGIVTDDASAALAAKMTEHAVERCEHGYSNRCWRCGIERVRDFELDETGAPTWSIAWRPIVAVEEAA